MAKRYDPILCMMVDEPTKAQDANKYVEQAIKWMKEGKGRLEILFGLQQMGLTPTDAAKYYAEAMTETGYKYRPKDAKASDRLVKVPDNKLKEFEGTLRSAGFKIVSKSDRGMTTHYQVEVSSSKKFTEADLREWANKIDSVCDKMESVAPTTWNIGLTVDGKITAGLDVREMYVKDSASAIDKAIKTADGMFASAFGEYSKGAKFKKDKFLKELAGISDAKEFAKRMQTLDNELRKNLERLDEAYNVAGKDYYAARNEIRSIMDAFSNEAFSLYRKLDTK